MSYAFAIIFLAAIVGIFKPYIKGTKRSYFAAAAAVSFVLVGITAAPSRPEGKGSAATATPRSETSGQKAVAEEGPAPSSDDASKWEYQNASDEMRGTSSKVAQVMSDNTVDLEFPYGEVHGQIWVRQRPEDGLNAAFEVEKGQILCHSFSESFVSIKFDDGPIQKFRCTDSSDGSNNVAFLNNAHAVLAGLKRSKRAIVEAEFFQQGRKQFTFDTAGLNWK